MSDEGFIVDAIIGGGFVNYREGARRTKVVAYEREDGVVDLMHRVTPEWQIGSTSEPMPLTDQRRVLENVRRALPVLGYQVA